MFNIAKKKSKYSKTKKKQTNTLNIVLYSSLVALVVGILFAFIFFLGERFGFLPVINLGGLTWGESGDAVVIFIIAFISSVFMGSLMVLFIVRKNIRS